MQEDMEPVETHNLIRYQESVLGLATNKNC